MKYRKKPVVVEATQWLKHGDHAAVTPHNPSWDNCGHCGKSCDAHGWVNTLEGGHKVCPEDYIITGIAGEFYPCKPNIFEATYEVYNDN